MKKPEKAHKVGRQRSLVQRLRTPLAITQYSDKVGSIIATGAKIDAIGEALAYLIEKKHMKRRVKKAKRGA